MHPSAQLYVLRTQPNHWRSFVEVSASGLKRYLRTLVGEGFFRAFSALGILSFPVDSAIENVDDCEEIFSKFSGPAGVHLLIENHDFDSVRLKDPLKQFVRESTQPISVGNHNFGDRSCACEIQDGPEACASEVDA